MKKLLYLLSVVSLLGFTLSKESLIVGTWDIYEKCEECENSTFIFKADGTYRMTIGDSAEDGEPFIITGTYKIKNDSITFSFNNSEERDDYKIEKLTTTDLIMSRTFESETSKVHYRRRKK